MVLQVLAVLTQVVSCSKASGHGTVFNKPLPTLLTGYTPPPPPQNNTGNTDSKFNCSNFDKSSGSKVLSKTSSLIPIPSEISSGPLVSKHVSKRVTPVLGDCALEPDSELEDCDVEPDISDELRLSSSNVKFGDVAADDDDDENFLIPASEDSERALLPTSEELRDPSQSTKLTRCGSFRLIWMIKNRHEPGKLNSLDIEKISSQLLIEDISDIKYVYGGRAKQFQIDSKRNVDHWRQNDLLSAVVGLYANAGLPVEHFDLRLKGETEILAKDTRFRDLVPETDIIAPVSDKLPGHSDSNSRIKWDIFSTNCDTGFIEVDLEIVRNAVTPAYKKDLNVEEQKSSSNTSSILHTGSDSRASGSTVTSEVVQTLPTKSLCIRLGLVGVDNIIDAKTMEDNLPLSVYVFVSSKLNKPLVSFDLLHDITPIDKKTSIQEVMNLSSSSCSNSATCTDTSNSEQIVTLILIGRDCENFYSHIMPADISDLFSMLEQYNSSTGALPWIHINRIKLQNQTRQNRWPVEGFHTDSESLTDHNTMMLMLYSLHIVCWEAMQTWQNYKEWSKQESSDVSHFMVFRRLLDFLTRPEGDTNGNKIRLALYNEVVTQLIKLESEHYRIKFFAGDCPDNIPVTVVSDYNSEILPRPDSESSDDNADTFLRTFSHLLQPIVIAAAMNLETKISPAYQAYLLGSNDKANSPKPRIQQLFKNSFNQIMSELAHQNKYDLHPITNLPFGRGP